jgi:hypothetical protein
MLQEVTTARNSAGGAPKGNRNSAKSGHYALEKSLKRDGFSVLTRRQRETVAEWRRNIEADAGGREQLSQLKQFQLERLLVTEVLIQSLDSWLLQQKSIINRRKKSAIPLLEQRSRLAETSLKLCAAIGLQRQSREVPSLSEYLREKALQEQTSQGIPPSESEG